MISFCTEMLHFSWNIGLCTIHCIFYIQRDGVKCICVTKGNDIDKRSSVYIYSGWVSHDPSIVFCGTTAGRGHLSFISGVETLTALAVAMCLPVKSCWFHVTIAVNVSLISCLTQSLYVITARYTLHSDFYGDLIAWASILWNPWVNRTTSEITFIFHGVVSQYNLTPFSKCCYLLIHHHPFAMEATMEM